MNYLDHLRAEADKERKAAEAHRAKAAVRSPAADTPKPPCRSCGPAPTHPQIRLLNLRRAHVADTAACAPDVRLFRYDDGTRVLYDCNSLSAAAVSPPIFHFPLSTSHSPAPVPPEALPPELRRTFGACVRPAPPCPRDGRVRRLILNITHACNLACVYCFDRRQQTADRAPDAAVGGPRSSVMSLDTARRAIALLDPSGPVDVGFFGGEPLIAPERIFEVCAFARALAKRRGVRAKFHVTTNGTLITPEIAARLRAEGFSVLLSCDGPEEIHNAARPLRGCGTAAPGSESSFARTMSGLSALNAHGIRPFMRATFTPENPRLVERLEFFAGLQADGKITGVSVEPAILAESCAASSGQRSAVSGQCWHEAAMWYVGKVRAGKPADLFYFRKLLGRLLECRLATSECGASRGCIAVNPDGAIYACHREEGTRIGHLDAGFDRAERDRWWDNRIDLHPACVSPDRHSPQGDGGCWARYLCGGGCRQARSALAGDLHADLPELCQERRAILREVLWIAAKLPPSDLRRITGIGGRRRA